MSSPLPEESRPRTPPSHSQPETLKERRRQESFNSQLSDRLHRNRPSFIHRATTALNRPGSQPAPSFRPSRRGADWQDATGMPRSCSPDPDDEKHLQKRLETVPSGATTHEPSADLSNIDLEANTGDGTSRILPTGSNIKTFFMQEVAHNYFLEAQLLILTIGTGIIDAMTYVSYSCFVSKQTGNAVFIALWANRHDSIRGGVEANVACSILFFVIGAAAFGHAGHMVKQRRRIWLLLSQVVQCGLVFAAAAIRWWVSNEQYGVVAAVCVSILSLACGGQISLALCVRLPELNTTMITGCLIQLATDRRAFALHNVARNRRVLFFLSLVAGAFIGAAAVRNVNATLAVLLFAIVKTCVALSFLLNHGMINVSKEIANSGTATPLTRILWGD